MNIGEYSPVFSEPEANNCFSIIFRGEYQGLQNNVIKQNAVAKWPAAGQGFQITKWPEVLNRHMIVWIGWVPSIP